MQTHACATDALAELIRTVAQTGYRFVTPTPLTVGRVRDRRLPGLARDLRDVFGWSLPFAPDLLPAELLGMMRAAGVLAEEGAGRLRSTVRLSSMGGTLFAHSAYPTTEPDSVFFGPDTYRFVRAIGQWRGTVGRAVDIGSGAGPGAVRVAQLWPEAEVFGVDINPRALALATANGAAAGVQVAWRESDLLHGVDGQFDLIVANPPYLVDQAERQYRHGGGPLGAALSLKILDVATERLQSGGTLLLYTGAAIVDGEDPFLQRSQSCLAGRDFTWTYDEIDPDVFGEELESGPYRTAERIAAVLLTVTKH